jgi:hypothetical protein
LISLVSAENRRRTTKTWRLRGGLWLERDLRGEGLVSTTIGMLLAAAEIAIGFGAPLRRAGDAHRTMLSGTALSMLLIAMIPLLAGMIALLLFQVIRSWLEG